jgi:hypothetical protein
MWINKLFHKRVGQSRIMHQGHPRAIARYRYRHRASEPLIRRVVGTDWLQRLWWNLCVSHVVSLVFQGVIPSRLRGYSLGHPVQIHLKIIKSAVSG